MSDRQVETRLDRGLLSAFVHRLLLLVAVFGLVLAPAGASAWPLGYDGPQVEQNEGAADPSEAPLEAPLASEEERDGSDENEREQVATSSAGLHLGGAVRMLGRVPDQTTALREEHRERPLRPPERRTR